MTSTPTPHDGGLCEQIGFDAATRADRLAFLDLAAADHALAAELVTAVIAPHVDTIIDRFYAKLQSDPVARTFIADADILQRLRTTQKDYLLSLGIGFDSVAYFEERLRVGHAHAWVGLPLMIYQCAYRALQQIVIDCMTQATAPDRHAPLSGFLLKITALDMSLAIEAYHHVQVTGLTRSLDRLQHRQQSLQIRASTDALTDTLNRAEILGLLERLRRRSRQAHDPIAIILLDLDFFKKVNDEHGHPTGDRVLQQVAARIKSAVRNVDAVGRYGGEEFLVVLPGASAPIATQIGERIRQHVAASPIKCDRQLIEMTISEGVTVLDRNDSCDAMIARADEALYRAKRAGRNRLVFNAPPTPQGDSVRAG